MRKNFLQQIRPSSNKNRSEGNSRGRDRKRPSIIDAIFSASKARSAALGSEGVQYGGALQFHQPNPLIAPKSA